jgi:hypothetical protein
LSDSQDICLFKLSFDFMQAFIAVVGFNPFNWKSPTPGEVDSSLFVGEVLKKRNQYSIVKEQRDGAFWAESP